MIWTTVEELHSEVTIGTAIVAQNVRRRWKALLGPVWAEPSERYELWDGITLGWLAGRDRICVTVDGERRFSVVTWEAPDGVFRTASEAQALEMVRQRLAVAKERAWKSAFIPH